MGCIPARKRSELELTHPIQREASFGKSPLSQCKSIFFQNNFGRQKNNFDQFPPNSGRLEAENSEFVIKTKTPQEIYEISQSLRNHFFLKYLSEDGINTVIDHIKQLVIGPQQVIFFHGCPPRNLYIISVGSVEEVTAKEKKNLTKGEIFGEISFLNHSPRTSTTISREKCTLWMLSGENFRHAIQCISNRQYEENKYFIESIPIFNTFDSDQKEILLSLLVSRGYHNDQVIVTEENMENLLCIIKSGEVSCVDQGKNVKRLGKGDYFGEQALLVNKTRTPKVVAIGNVNILSISRDDLQIAFGKNLEHIIYKNSIKISVDSNNLFENLTNSQISSIIDRMKIIKLKSGELISEGEKMKIILLIVLKGRVKSENKTFEIFDCSINKNSDENSSQIEPRKWVCEIDSEIAILTRKKLDMALETQLSLFNGINQLFDTFKRIPIFKGLLSDKLECLLNLMSIQEYNSGSKVFEEGDSSNLFYIIKEGQVEMNKNGIVIRILKKNDYFGEESIITNKNRIATAISSANTECWVISKENCLGIIDKNIIKQIKHHAKLRNNKISLNDLLISKHLAKGRFSNLFLVQSKSKKIEYALKTVSRAKINSFQIFDKLIDQRKFFLQIDHPFIVHQFKTFKDESRIYFLLEYVPGPSMADYLYHSNFFTMNTSKFYASCILLIIDHLHERNIVHRDLKPENFIIDSEGYPKLIDMGSAKIIRQRTYTIIGTPHYMAPEIIKSTGYGFAVDIWSLGVMIFEFLTGFVPFGSTQSDPYKIYGLILDKSLKFPDRVSQESIEIIQKMLEYNPAARGNTQNIKENLWFKGQNWDEILGKTQKSPYKPEEVKISDNENRKISDINEDKEELMFEEIKLSQIDVPCDWDRDF